MGQSAELPGGEIWQSLGRQMKRIAEVNIPLMISPPPDRSRLIAWRVLHGSRVEVGQILYDLEVGEQTYPVENLDSGIITILSSPDTWHEVGACVATIDCDRLQADDSIVLTSSELARWKTVRGTPEEAGFATEILRSRRNRSCDD